MSEQQTTSAGYAPAGDQPDTAPSCQLETITSEEMCELRFKRENYIVEGLLKPGLAVLAGAPKIGKSWLVLQLCLQVAKGEHFWEMPTQLSEVLYLALEDSKQRLQKRILTLTAEPSPGLHFALSCSGLTDELEQELSRFVIQHPLTRLIVIDTFQMIRSQGLQMSYANDYADVSRLKRLADNLRVCILLVHHTRKLGDNDRFNEISGTNGIAGSADTLMVLAKEKRTDRKATLTVTGRDVEDMELELTMDRRSCKWRCGNPRLGELAPPQLPEILHKLIACMKKLGRFEGTNGQFAQVFSAYLGEEVNMNQLIRKMNYFRYELEDAGVQYMQRRTHSDKCILIIYKERVGDASP